jgi:hypothetical protein
MADEEIKMIVDEETEIFRLDLKMYREKNIEDAPREKVSLNDLKLGEGIDGMCKEKTLKSNECLAFYIEVEPQF